MARLDRAIGGSTMARAMARSSRAMTCVNVSGRWNNPESGPLDRYQAAETWLSVVRIVMVRLDRTIGGNTMERAMARSSRAMTCVNVSGRWINPESGPL
jgi:hypothetical protein